MISLGLQFSLRESCAGSRVSFRFAALARDTRSRTRADAQKKSKIVFISDPCYRSAAVELENFETGGVFVWAGVGWRLHWGLKAFLSRLADQVAATAVLAAFRPFIFFPPLLANPPPAVAS